jgi:hypothetical protein
MIDPTKTYKTRDGREVRIYAVDGEGDFPVHGAVKTLTGWDAMSWSLKGATHYNNAMPVHDLIEVRPRIKREVWVNVYPLHVSVTYETKADADKGTYQQVNRIACVKLAIDCEEGEGL